VIVHKELLKFSTEFLPKISNGLYISPTVGIPLHGDNSIVMFFMFLVAFVELLAFNHTYGTTQKHTSWEGRLIHQHQYINGIGIVGFGEGTNPKS
jgi:hypothetical protein